MPWRLLGRETEIGSLTRILDDTAAGAGGFHTLTGPPGIGKSRLLRFAAERARPLGITVATREAFQLDQAAPLVTLAGALRDCRPASAAFGWLAHREPERADPFGTLQRLRASLEEAARERPLLIMIDDAQWMDELSALAIRELIPALASSPVRWLFAHRPPSVDDRRSPGHQLIQWLARDGGPPIRVHPLREAAIAQLSAEVVGAQVDNTVIALAASCGGNPLRAEQLLKALIATGQLLVTDGVASVIGDDLPSSFVESVRELLDTLSPEAGLLLRATSVFGRPFGIEEAARLTGRPVTDLYPLVGEAMTDFLVEDGLGGLAFAHDLVRQAVYSMLPFTMRQQLHRETAAMTRDAGRPALEVAEHQLRSGAAGAADAVRMVRSVAREIARVAPSAAAEVMLRALTDADPGDPERPALIADTVGLLAAAARLEEARKLGVEALGAGLDPQTEAVLLLGLAEACKHGGLNVKAVGYADDALRQTGVSPAVRARLHAVRAHALCYLGDLAGADDSGARSDELGRGAGEHGAAVFGLSARSLVAFTEGRLRDSLEHARTATALADASGGEAAHRHPRIWLGAALIALDEFGEAQQVIRAGRRESDRSGAAWTEPLWHHFQSTLYFATGRVEEAAVEAESGLAVVEQHSAYALAMPLLGMLMRIAVLRGDLAAAQAHREHVRELERGGVTAVPEDVLWPEAVLLSASGDQEGAFTLLSEVYAALPERPALLATEPGAAAAMVRIALDTGHKDTAESVVHAARRFAGRNPGVHGGAGAAAHAAGLYHQDVDRVLVAAEEFRLAGRPLALAAALEDAMLLGHEPAPQTEAAPVAADRSATCLPSLTPAERRVALQVGAGRTNIEIAEILFISKHTVDAHLRNIFAKLGVRRRAELAALVARECGATT
ncbi:helix-turn-helix transcriptional regulator [Actinoplanes sp. OR16]|uniref:ATP-binding protein n=1 Tax=Actinoplanes sp. OR16 TaxID=946334 RepID=UPI000F6C1073|nr:LuxR family transcriptional regulator [Actinoplanes sp. OR16]BBH71804.1 helix-turn-helix transcriptional regulator [Actinoplanes sp. OR16]